MKKSILTFSLTILFVFSAGLLPASYTNMCFYSFPTSYDGTGFTVTDIGGLGHHAMTLTNIDSYVEEAPSGMTGGSFNSGVPNDFITDAIRLLSNEVIEAYGGFTFEAWVKWNGDPCINGKIIDYAGTEILSFNDDHFRFGMVNNPGYNYDDIRATGIVQDVWYHLIGTFDTQGNTIDVNGGIAGLMRLFVNDELKAEMEFGKGVFGDDLNRPTAFGNHPRRFADNDFKGLIYNPRVVYGLIPTPVPPSPPENVTATDNLTDMIQVSWDAPSYATNYMVFRALVDDTNAATDISGVITVTNYNDTSAGFTNTYYYWVKAGNEYGFSEFSASDAGYRTLPGLPDAPQNVQASRGTYDDKVALSWDVVTNADSYAVFRNTTDNSAGATNISGDITETTYDDTSAEVGIIYYYWIRAKNAGGWGPFSDSVQGYLELPSLAYEGFDYPSGEALNGKNGGYGWSDPWVASESAIQEIHTEGLTYPGLQTSGRSVKLTAIEATGEKAEGNRDTMISYGVQTNDIWYSFLLKADIPQVGHMFVIPNDTWDCGSGKAWGNTLSLHNWRSDTDVDPEETYFMVVRCINGGAYLWINPSLEREPVPGMADVSQDVTTLFHGNKINIQVQRYYMTNSFIFDEIRLGYTWDEVSPNYIVKNVQASDGTYDDKVVVTWDTRGDAVGYTVYRNTVNDSSSATAVSSELTGSSYDDTTATAGTVYFYWIKGRFQDGTENFSYSDAGYRSVAGAPAAPQNVNASDGVADQTYVRVTWDASTGADVYRVYRNGIDDYASAEAVSSDIVATDFDDSDVAAGVAYYYWVRAKNATGWSNYSDPDTGYIPAQLVAYYAMDELEGTNMLDSSENEFDGLYRDNPTLGVASADAALFNTAVNFDVSDAVINSNSPIRDLTNNFTVAMWVNPDEIGQDEYRYLFAPEEAGGWNLSVYNRNIVFSIPGASGTWSPANILTNGVWTHVAVTYSHLNYAKMYINGYQVGDEQFYGVAAQYVKCDTLVANGGEQELFIGSLDEIRVYSGVLTDDEILWLVIPEPGILGMVMLAALGVVFMRRR
jgi:fibronectin type 3 domain-containing protein